jgi:predicted  nucleic acid-binding Zn-ribbon protein
MSNELVFILCFQLTLTEERISTIEARVKELTSAVQSERTRRESADQAAKDLRTRIAELTNQIFQKEQELDTIKVCAALMYFT